MMEDAVYVVRRRVIGMEDRVWNEVMRRRRADHLASASEWVRLAVMEKIERDDPAAARKLRKP